ncbi:MAG: ribonuclease E activity regulator RraA [Pseudomonadota bacterium]|nr:MAG: ribonuclease E activity regulator RraA [Pseudomonadota bacterium]
MSSKTADLCDQYSDRLQIASPGLLDFGGRLGFSGEIVTLKLFEDNSLVRELLGTKGAGKVLVVDGGGSMRCALLGDMLAGKAVENGWSGLVINGCIRDALEIAILPLGVKALGTHPQKSEKKGTGERNIPVSFSQVTFRTGHYLYADRDGLVVAAERLPVPG